MKDSRIQLLQMIYDHDQSEGGPLQIPLDGSEVGLDRLTLSIDVAYLESHSYVSSPMRILGTYVLELTEKGELFVENGFQLPAASPTTNFNFANTNFHNSIVANTASDNEITVHTGSSLTELQSLIQSKSKEDRAILEELLSAIESLEKSQEPVRQGIFARFSDTLKKHTDLIAPIGNALVNVLFRVN